MPSPSLVLPWKNSTWLMVALVPAAVAVISMLAGGVNRELFAGVVMLTVGGTAATRVTGEDVPNRPLLSVAVAVRL